MNISLFQEQWNNYKILFFDKNKHHQEHYKWDVLNQVIKRWDWGSDDKIAMINSSFDVQGNNNLWSSMNYYPIKMAIWFMQDFPEETIAIFTYLFNEKIDLNNRLEYFKQYFDHKLPELQKKYPETKLGFHNQDIRSMSLYLFVNNPNKYSLFKYNIVKDFAEKFDLGVIKKGQLENYSKYLEIVATIKGMIIEDPFIDKYIQYNISNNLYADESLNLLIQDFIFASFREFNTINNKKYWLFSPGENGSMWEEFYKEGYMGLGWDELGDLNNYESKEEINLTLKDIYSTDSSLKNNTNANNDFVSRIKPKDIIFAKKGRTELLGYGEVTSEYYFDQNADKYKHRRKVNWKKKGKWKVPQNMVLKTLTDITDSSSSFNEGKKYYEDLISIINDQHMKLESSDINENVILSDVPLNQILYGPPGTGKTYYTINKALSIIEDKTMDELETEERQNLKNRFKDYVDTGQIVFTTFHQSMSYEDFIEGIKPDLDEDEDGNKIVFYDVKDGIFKEIVKSAKKPVPIQREEANVYGFEEAWDELTSSAQSLLAENKYLELTLISENRKIDIVNITSNGNLKLKPKNGREKGYTVSYNRLRKLFEVFKDLSLVKNIDKEFRSVIGGSNSTAYWAVLNFVNNKIASNLNVINADNKKFLPHVLIIDEINRGNVSAIFGELITLIEESKRQGNPEALEVTLPYSKDKFSIPSNLYIIGTMNTADRSVEALDTALRRRFVFEEMLPKTDLEELNYKVYGYKLSEILDRINLRIEKLVDRDHCIGHAYFINKNEETIIDSFYMNIIPLLQEYFFGDYGKIGLVLGKGFVRLKETETKIFADFSYDYKEDLESRAVYEIIDYRNDNKEAFGNAIAFLMNNG